MNYICEVSGYCPIKDCDIEIDVKYISVPVLGSIIPSIYKNYHPFLQNNLFQHSIIC